MSRERGVLIVIEGADGSGKKTQTEMLVDRLNTEGFPAEKMSFPRYYTPTGRIISQCYLGKERTPEEGDVAWFGDANSVDPLLASLFYAADRYAAVPEMMAILESGTHLILDRYYQSNMAHQGGKIPDRDKRLDFFQRLGNIELMSLGIPREDRVIFLFVPGEVSKELRKDREDSDGHENSPHHLRNAVNVYEDLASIHETWERVDCAPDGTIDSLRSLEDIHEDVYDIAMRTIKWTKGENVYYRE